MSEALEQVGIRDRLHGCLLDIALEIQRVCEENNIRYYLIGGSIIMKRGAMGSRFQR